MLLMDFLTYPWLSLVLTRPDQPGKGEPDRYTFLNSQSVRYHTLTDDVLEQGDRLQQLLSTISERERPEER